MTITIHDQLSIDELQQQFNSKYPYLKLECFTKPHGIHSGSRKENMIPSSTLIKNCRTKHNEGKMEINPDHTVAQIEKSFQDIFGLYVQVFRKSGNVWIETTVTDDWTLEKQNSEAELFHKDMEKLRSDQNTNLY